MEINRKRAKKAFAEYVSNYDVREERVTLKIDHTYRVSELCEVIAGSLGLEKAEVDLAWLLGLLHDIGRFEQLKRYGTFLDGESVDHAWLGNQILFEEGKIRDFVDSKMEDALIEKVISCHNQFQIPEELNERERQFANILRDADKIDILKVNVIVSMEEIYQVSTKQLKTEEISPDVMESFKREETTVRTNKQNAIDKLAGHISFAYGLVYPVSIKIMTQQGYLDRMMHFKSENPKTLQQLEEIRGRVYTYLNNRIKNQ